MFKYVYNSFLGGILDDRILRARQDLGRYRNGVSDMDNFELSCQGTVSKRRGTDAICSLDGLLGYKKTSAKYIKNTVEHVRMIPFCYEKNGGYFILFSDNKMFVGSRKGLMLADGTFSRTIGAFDESYYQSEKIPEKSYDASVVYDDGTEITGLTLQNAIDRTDEGKTNPTIHLCRNVTQNSTLTITPQADGHRVRIDMRGFGISLKNNAQFSVSTDLEIFNSVTNKSKITGNCSNDMLYFNNGNFHVRNNIEISNTNTGATNSTIYFTSTTDYYAMMIDKDVNVLHSGSSSAVIVKGFWEAEEGSSTLYSNTADIRGDIISYAGNGIYGDVGSIISVLDGNVTAQRHGITASPYSSVSVLGGTVTGGFGITTTNAQLAYAGIYGLGVGNYSTDGKIFVAGGVVTGRIGILCENNAVDITLRGGNITSSANTINPVLTNGIGCAIYKGNVYSNNSDINKIYIQGTVAYANLEIKKLTVVSTQGGSSSYSNTFGIANCTGTVTDSQIIGNSYASINGTSTSSQYEITYTGCQIQRAKTALSSPAWSNVNRFSKESQFTTCSYYGKNQTFPVNTGYVTQADFDIPVIFDSVSGSGLTPTGSTTVVATDIFNEIPKEKRPFYRNAPWNDYDIQGVKFMQSGDTLICTSKEFNPFKIMKQGGIFEIEAINLNKTTIKTPSIASTSSSGWGTVPDTSVQKSVEYACSAVCDGEESFLSGGKKQSYYLPWPNTGKVTVNVSPYTPIGGATCEEIRIYKNNGGEYGYIGSIKATVWGELPFSMSDNVEMRPYQEECFYSDDSNERYTRKLNAISLACQKPRKNVFLRTDTYGNPVLAGGAKIPASETFRIAFDGANGINIKKMYIGFDTHQCVGKNYEYTPCVGFLKLTASDGTTFKQEIPTGETGGTYTPGIRFSDATYYDAFKKTLEIDIGSLKSKQISWIDVEVFTTNSYATKADLLLHEISFMQEYNDVSKQTTFTDDYISPSLSLSPIKNSSNFTSQGSYPSFATIFQQRLFFASTIDEPMLIRASCVGDLYNFSVHATIQEDDAMSFQLPAMEFPTINWMIASRDYLVVFCDNGEWSVNPVSGNTLSYKTISSKKQSLYSASSTIEPLIIGTELLFMESNDKVLRTFSYGFASDGFDSMDLSVVAMSLFDNRQVIATTFKKSPDNSIICVMTDGTVLRFAYMKEQEVYAWSRFTMHKSLKITGACSDRAFVYTLYGNGSGDVNTGNTNIYYLARFDNTHQDNGFKDWCVLAERPAHIDINATQFDPVHRCCLDCTTIATQDEFEYGRTAYDTETGQIVTQPDGVTQYLWGFPYEAKITTAYPISQQADINFEIKNASDIEARVKGDEFEVAPIDNTSDWQKCKIDSRTGILYETADDVRCKLSGDNSADGRVCIRHTSQFPFEINYLAINYEIQPISGAD